jgi:hypothetical protein
MGISAFLISLITAQNRPMADRMLFCDQATHFQFKLKVNDDGN